ncbi:MAG: phytanoyl-CoA dioxygenase family protein [Candidatus Poribacteria bacterium]|nr:phytanoyl-CoA dioxygenase family protein [Candidatus Poribacteria bacterium]
MKVNPQQLLDDGYIILRQVIPPKQLDELRDSFEVLVERQKTVWARERKPDDPPGGAWETSAQPRVFFDEVVNEETANAVEFCLHENTLGVSQQLMRAPEAAPTLMALMCSPVRDHGPASWHRDIDPVGQAPLRGMQMDILKNASGYVQWNIPLYDDRVFWIVPKSHRRPNTPAEQHHLLTDARAPIPGGIPVELSAGDGVVYTHVLLHWGSNYSTRLRRTIHLGYRAFGGDVYPMGDHFYWNLGFTKHLSQRSRARFEHFFQLHQQQCDLIESTFRAILNRDADGFLNGLVKLHPGTEERMVCVVYLSKLADKTRTLKNPDIINLSLEERIDAISAHRLSFYLFEDFARRFSVKEAHLLCERFSTLFEKVETERVQSVPDATSRVRRYQLTQMPANFDVEDFIHSWDA